MQLTGATQQFILFCSLQRKTLLACLWKSYQFELKVMRTLAFILLVFNLQLSAYTTAQYNITIHEKGASLEKILKQVAKQTGYSFFFAEENQVQAKLIDINVKNASLKAVLDICFKEQPLIYNIIGKNILIRPKEDNNASGSIKNPGIMVSVNGVITDENGMPVQGANITIKGTTRGTSTDYKGEFQLQNLHENDVLVISSMGYNKQEIAVSKNTFIKISLKLAVGNLDEIQIIGYGTTSKRLSTGNVSTIKSKDIARQPVDNPLLALQGRITGLQIAQSTGLPGAGIRVQIRGQNSIANGNEPLYIIDGVPYTSLNLHSPIRYVLGNASSSGNYVAGSPLSYINPADIESIDILKDADATAIYGSRGANGVILITTKKGKAGTMKFDVNFQQGWGKVSRKLKVLNTRQYLDMRYEAFKNDNATPNVKADYDLTLWDTTRYTDWQKVLIGGTARYTDLQLAIYGGNEYAQYRLAAGYHRETTVFPGDFNDRKPTVQFNLNGISPNKKFRVSLSGIFTGDINNLSSYDLTEQAVLLPPNAPSLYNSDGSINWAHDSLGRSTWPRANPVSMLMRRFKSKTTNLISNVILSYKILPSLEFKTSLGYNTLQTNDIRKETFASIDPSTWANSQRAALFFNSSVESWIIEPQISYNAIIQQGNFSAIIGSTIQQTKNLAQSYSATGFNSDLLLEDIGSASSVKADPGINSVYKYNAAFARISYNWQDKYLVNLTGRRDGTSRFGPAKRFSNFGGIGLGWVFTKENFVQQAIRLLDYGKLRLSYGTTGNDQVDDYTYMDLYNPLTAYVPYQDALGTQPKRIFTPDLAWEQTKKLEAGMELVFDKDKVVFRASFYRNRSSNQLMSYSLPSITGFTSIQKNLNALVENKGWEFEITTINLSRKNFNWTTTFNLTLNRNKLISGPPDLSALFQRKIGSPLNSVFLYQYAGVNIVKGLYQVLDIHGNPTTDLNPNTDKTVLLDLTSKYFGGLQNSFTWKSLQLDFHFQFVNRPNAPIYLYHFVPGSFSGLPGSTGSNQPVTVLNRWQQAGDVKNIQKFSQNTSTFGAREIETQSTHAYGDASFVKLKNVSLSWQLPQKWNYKSGITSSRIFIQGQNLFTITNYQGLDPETGTLLALPPLRMITVGFQLSL